ncbi:zinc finger MYM-type protein 5-like [Armigeres subalbatus]|uniref:zinc finger MYM-type protein 5-like n=1 Tax=Armigeres subalbatus TaxID=124917 RepID=UPI002ED0DFFF
MDGNKKRDHWRKEKQRNALRNVAKQNPSMALSMRKFLTTTPVASGSAADLSDSTGIPPDALAAVAETNDRAENTVAEANEHLADLSDSTGIPPDALVEVAETNDRAENTVAEANERVENSVAETNDRAENSVAEANERVENFVTEANDRNFFARSETSNHDNIPGDVVNSAASEDVDGLMQSEITAMDCNTSDEDIVECSAASGLVISTPQERHKRKLGDAVAGAKRPKGSSNSEENDIIEKHPSIARSEDTSTDMPALMVGQEFTRDESTTSNVNDPSTAVPKDRYEFRILVEKGPYQPLQPSYPSSTKSKRSFRAEWFKQHIWLEYSTSKDACFCFYCRFFGKENSAKVGHSDPAFTERGFNNWKKATESFSKHNRSDFHNGSMRAWDMTQKVLSKN